MPHSVMQAWLPATCAHTMVSDSAITGFTLPGIMDEPGCTAGSSSSPSPARGPLPTPLTETSTSIPPCADK